LKWTAGALGAAAGAYAGVIWMRYGRPAAAQIQEDLLVVRPHVRQFDVHLGCRGRRVRGRHPLQTTDALGAAGTHLGPHAVALLVLLNKQLGLSQGKIATLLRDWFGCTCGPAA
jgi:hypothetical protein